MSGAAQQPPALTTQSKRPGGVDRVARTGVCRVCSLEVLECLPRALNGVTGDLAKLLRAQRDLTSFVRHG